MFGRDELVKGLGQDVWACEVCAASGAVQADSTLDAVTNSLVVG